MLSPFFFLIKFLFSWTIIETISVCVDGTETFTYTADTSLSREKFISTIGEEINDYLTKLIKESETSEPKCIAIINFFVCLKF